MDFTGLPPRRERSKDRALDCVPVFVGVGLAVFCSIPGLPWFAPLAPRMLFIHPMVFGPWWLGRFASRMQLLARVPLREDLWLASIPAWNYLERELDDVLSRLRASFVLPTVAWGAGTIVWGFVQTLPIHGRAYWGASGEGAFVFLLLGSVLVAEQMVACRLVRLTAWETLERLTAPGAAARTAHFRLAVRCLVLIFGPFAFVMLWALAAGLTAGIGGFGGFLFIPFCYWLAWWLGKRADVARERAVEGYYRFE